MINKKQTVSVKAITLVSTKPDGSETENTRKELEAIGANSVEDHVSLTTTVSSLLADILDTMDEPVAPILRMKHYKDLESIVVNIDEDIPLSDTHLEYVKKAMSDDVLWASIPFFVVVNEGRLIQIKSEGVFLFKEVLNEVVGAFI